MKKPIITVLAAVMLAGGFLPVSGQEWGVTERKSSGVEFIVDLRPGSMLFSSDIDGFEIRSCDTNWFTAGNVGDWNYYKGSTWDGINILEGTGSFIPNFSAGIGINTPVLYIDITGGFGYQYNTAFNGLMTFADVAARFKLGDFVTLGPHLGIVNFSPKWSGLDAESWSYSRVSDSDDIKFSPGTGTRIGVTLTAGKRKISFVGSIDYINVKCDIKSYNRWYIRALDDDTVNRYDYYDNTSTWTRESTIDLSGVAIQLGVLFGT